MSEIILTHIIIFVTSTAYVKLCNTITKQTNMFLSIRVGYVFLYFSKRLLLYTDEEDKSEIREFLTDEN